MSNQAQELRDLPRSQAAFDIFENEEGYLLRADLPGVQRGDVDIHFERKELTVRARRERPTEGERLVGEFGDTSFERSFRLPESIDGNAIRAELEAGVLTLTLPKAPEVRPRKIAIQPASS